MIPNIEPAKEWVKELIDEIIAEEFASPDLELHWLDEDDNDSGRTEAALESRVKLGAVTLNEMRGHLGLDPYANSAADRPMVLTPTGFVPIEANAGGEGDASANINGQAAAAVQKYSPDQPRIPAGEPGAGQWTNGNTENVESSGDVATNPSSLLMPATVPDSRQEESVGAPDVQSIINSARRLNVAAGPDAYQKCLDLCYPLLERFQSPGSDRNTWNFHKCMNACLARNL